MRMPIVVMPVMILAAVLLGTSSPAARAQDAQGVQQPQELQQPVEEQQPADQADQAEPEMKPTEVGVRFTPRMAYAMSGVFTREMKTRYELNDQQAEEVREIIATRMMKTVSENAESARNAIEMMMETAIEHDGHFPKESAQDFAREVKPLVPAFRNFFVQTAGEIGKKMSVKQRLKFSADVAAATAGFAIFENRMARWEEGKVGDNANPFWDPGDTDPAASQPSPEDPNETPEHRQVRQSAENQLRWDLDVENRWTAYVDQAIEFYQFDEAQTNSARGILKDILDRVKTVKTPDWQQRVKENRIATNMSWRVGGAKFNQGPLRFKLESQYDQLTKPLFDMGKELKSRIEDLPTSAQRAKAMETVRKAFAEKGMTKLPL